MTDILTTLQGDLGKLATADTIDPQNGTATTQPALTAVQEVLSLLADQSLVGQPIGQAVSSVYTAIGNAITDDVVKALQAIAGQLTSVSMAGTNVSDVGSALQSLQNVLQTAQSLVPGGSSAAASALASTSQFATLFGDLLKDAGDLPTAANQLYEIAQQLQAIASAFTTAAQGNP
jgi:hypothetical protein